MFKRALLYAVCFALVCGLFIGCAVNPVTGKKEFSLVSQDQEIAMGNAYHPDIIFMYDGEYQDAALKQYLGSIVMRLNEVSHRSEMAVDFTVLNTSMINAFAILRYQLTSPLAMPQQLTLGDDLANIGRVQAYRQYAGPQLAPIKLHDLNS